jgi:hypothetical protein
MASADGVSFGQRVYNWLYRIFGPAQISEAQSQQTDLADSAVEQAEQLGQWEKATDGTRTWLVRREPDQPS